MKTFTITELTEQDEKSFTIRKEERDEDTDALVRILEKSFPITWDHREGFKAIHKLWDDLETERCS